jgi:hypothetical protein
MKARLVVWGAHVPGTGIGTHDQTGTRRYSGTAVGTYGDQIEGGGVGTGKYFEPAVSPWAVF